MKPPHYGSRRSDWRLTSLLLLSWPCWVSCGSGTGGTGDTGEDPAVKVRGTIEVSAKLVEIPAGAIFKRDLYNYATVLKYQVVDVHRGTVKGNIIYVGHYNPFKPRSEAADQRVRDVGGDLQEFQAGQLHRMALEPSIDDCYMGGIVNKYFDEHPEPIYWAVWTNLASD